MNDTEKTIATTPNSIRLRVVRDVVQHMTLEEKEQLRNELALELDQAKANSTVGFAERPQSGTTDSAGNDSVLDELEQFINDYAATDPAAASDGAAVLAEMRRVTGFARLRVVAADIHAHYPNADVSARLTTDRCERDAAMK